MMLTVKEITASVATAFDIDAADITGPSAKRLYSYPRFVVYSIAHDEGYSSTAIGRRLNRDHTSVLAGSRRVEEISARDDAYAAKVRDIRAALKPGMSITDRILEKVRAAQ